MKKRNFKILCLMITVFMMLSVIPYNVLAVEKVDDFVSEMSETAIAICGHECASCSHIESDDEYELIFDAKYAGLVIDNSSEDREPAIRYYPCGDGPGHHMSKYTLTGFVRLTVPPQYQAICYYCGAYEWIYL